MAPRQVGRRLLLLLGPPSGGKSTLVILLKRGLEEYSYTDEGALYTQCVDRETGRLAWERKEAPARHEDANGLNEPSASTPVTEAPALTTIGSLASNGTNPPSALTDRRYEPAANPSMT